MKSYRPLTLGLIVVLATLVYTLWNVSVSELVESFFKVDYIYLLFIPVILLFINLLRAFRWRALLSHHPQIRFSGLFSSLMVGAMGNLFPARAGEFLRAYLLAQKYKIPYSASLSSIVLERVFDLFFLLVLVASILFLYPQELFLQSEHTPGNVQDLAIRFIWVAGTAIGTFSAVIYLFLYKRTGLWITMYRGIRKLPPTWRRKVGAFLRGFRRSMIQLVESASLVRPLFLSFLIWVGIVLSSYPLFFAYDLQDKSMKALLILTVVVSVAVTLLPTPGFLGSYNAGVLIALNEIMDEPRIKAISMGFVGWTLNFGFIVLAGLVFIFWEHFSVRQLIQLGQRRK